MNTVWKPGSYAMVKAAKERSFAFSAWRRLKKQKAALAGLAILLFFFLSALCAPWIAPFPFDGFDPARSLQPPSGDHWFGTDDLGRDVFSRILYGARISLWVGISSVMGSVIIGVLLGLVAGYFGKWVDTIISRLFDVMLAFPSILLAIAIVAVLGPSLFNALLAIAIINVPTYGRLVRSRVLSIKQEEYITAARVIGMSYSRLLLHHVLPNCIAPIIVQGTLGIATAIIEAAALGFLGLGAQPGEPEWGKMLSDSKQFLTIAPWTILFPGFAIMLTVLAFNMFGDGLRDALDPKMKQT